ncbi:MAG TPA: FliH/SctL family protein [Methylibium sp.]
MTTSSFKRRSARQVPPPQAGVDAAKTAYARFIPREELHSFAAWRPGALGGDGVQAEPAAPNEADLAAQTQAARQAGYQDGYRDGLAALEGFKQSYAAQVTAQLASIAGAFQQQLGALEQDLAHRLAGVALSLARQVVRSELNQRPQLVVDVAQEALGALLLSARHVSMRVNPDDHALVAQGTQELMAARGARLLPDAQVTRGGCVVESDIGVIDASVEMRWRRAAEAMGRESNWTASEDEGLS